MEKDIKILEERVTTLKRHIKNYEESDCKTNVYQQLVKECNAIKNLLKRYKELEEMLKHRIKYTRELEQDLFENARNYVIPISVIQNKITPVIDELEKDGFVGYADELRDILDEILEKGNK